MTIEEKAKAYDEVLEQAKFYYGNCPSEPERKKLEKMFPELRESEDERIRKEIIDFIQWAEDRGMTRHDYHQEKRPAVWIAYLEKHKEQKPVDYDHEMWKNCEANFEGGKKEVIEHPEKYGLQKEQKPTEDVIKSITKNKEAAIKFLKSAGIMDDNGELAEMYRSEQESTEIDFEDWDTLGYIRDIVRKHVKRGEEFNVLDKWLTEHYVIQKPAEWSKDDKKLIDDVINSLCCYQNTLSDYQKEIVGEEIRKLKSLKPQPKQEWSKEDEKHINIILRVLDRQQCWDGATGKKCNPYQDEIDWLKSLRPKPYWKPSEEQMEALKTAKRWYSDNMGCNLILESLFEQLEKQM